MEVHDIPAEYEATIGAMNARMRQTGSRPAGDPKRAAEIIVQAAARENVPSHLLVGVNAVEMSLAYSKKQLAEAEAWEQVSRSADFDQPYPVPQPADAV
jgi:hypothetical protein